MPGTSGVDIGGMLADASLAAVMGGLSRNEFLAMAEKRYTASKLYWDNSNASLPPPRTE
jgi:hypothetical protein